MAGKFVTLIISGILLFSISASLCFAEEDAELNKQKENILSLIEAGKFSEAKAATGKMTIEFPGLAKLPDMLYWIAGRYQTFDRFEDAKQIQEQIIRDYPDSPWAKKARMGNSMTEAMSLIMSGKYAEARVVTDKMAVDFAGSPDLPEMLYWIAERFQRVDRFDEAKQIYQRIIDDFLTTSFAKRAKLSISRAQVESFIVSQKYDDANAALDKFIADFSKSPDLPEALFWITERYERLVRLEEARQNYQRIMDRFTNNLYAKRAKLGISRAEVIALVEAGDFNNAILALNKMTSDFASHSDMPWSLYLVAQRYESKGKQDDANGVCQQIIQNYPDSLYASKVAEEHPSTSSGQVEIKDVNLNPDLEKAAVELYRIARGYEEAKDFDSATKAYQQVVKDYPATIKGNNAVLDIRRLEILQAIDSKGGNYVDILLDKFSTDFKGHSYADSCLDMVARVYYKKARLANLGGDIEKEKAFYTKAIKVWECLIYALPDSKIAPDACFALGVCYVQELGKYQKGLDYFQQIINKWPDYEYAQQAQLLITEYSNKMEKIEK